MVIRRKHADEKIPADTENQSRRFVSSSPLPTALLGQSVTRLQASMAEGKPACRTGGDRIGEPVSSCFATHLFTLLLRKDSLCNGYAVPNMCTNPLPTRLPGKVGVSVLTRGMAMDFVREGKKDMAITSIWPASLVRPAHLAGHMLMSPLSVD
jgi:hypothetical protein